MEYNFQPNVTNQEGQREMYYQFPIPTNIAAPFHMTDPFNPQTNFNHSYQSMLLQQQQQIAYWYSKAMAFSYENKVLHAIIDDLNRKGIIANNSENISQYDDTQSNEDQNENDLVISEEMLEFLQKSAEHRRKRDKEKMKFNNDFLNKDMSPKDPIDYHKVATDLYGSEGDKIFNLETLIKLNYDQYLDRNDPVHWPNIPLNL